MQHWSPLIYVGVTEVINSDKNPDPEDDQNSLYSPFLSLSLPEFENLESSYTIMNTISDFEFFCSILCGEQKCDSRNLRLHNMWEYKLKNNPITLESDAINLDKSSPPKCSMKISSRSVLVATVFAWFFSVVATSPDTKFDNNIEPMTVSKFKNFFIAKLWSITLKHPRYAIESYRNIFQHKLKDYT